MQALASSQLTSWPTHAPPLQTSPVVQASPSSQGDVPGVPVQVPPLQASLSVQPFPSSQFDVLFAFRHPSAGSHESSVQGLESSHVAVEPLEQAPPLQVSPSVQGSPSSQGAELSEC